jgi:uncharacterized membrane protein
MLSSSDTANIDIGSHPVTTVAGLESNTLWDGFFHTATWLAVVVGLAILYSRLTVSRGRIWTSRVLWGWMLQRSGQIGRPARRTAATDMGS